jgi:hypothetical protein
MQSQEAKRVADIQVITDGVQPFVKVTVPKGTTFVDTIKLQPFLSDILGKLRGCLSCNSGVPIWFQEREEIEHIVRVDLDRFQRIG